MAYIIEKYIVEASIAILALAVIASIIWPQYRKWIWIGVAISPVPPFP